jgi:hypothetical protein
VLRSQDRLAAHGPHHGRREVLFALHSCLACFMSLDCTQQTVLLHSLDMQKSALERYLNTAAGWLMLLWHHPIRRLRTALLEGGRSRTHLGSEPGPNASPLRLRAGSPLCGFLFPQRCSELQSGQQVRIWQRSSLQHGQTTIGTVHISPARRSHCNCREACGQFEAGELVLQSTNRF